MKPSGKNLLKEFENMKDLAEINALSKYSLDHPLNDLQYKRMMELKKKVFG
jgi:hypothetical protein